MKIRMQLNPEDPARAELAALGIEEDETSEYILSRRGGEVSYLPGRKGEQMFFVPVQEIVYIDSLGHDVRIQTLHDVYMTRDRLKQLEKVLDTDRFLRVSNSAIINTRGIRRIEASLLQKFILHMANGDTVDVTRSYYYIFRERFNL